MGKGSYSAHTLLVRTDYQTIITYFKRAEGEFRQNRSQKVTRK